MSNTTFESFSPTSLPSLLASEFRPPKPRLFEQDLHDLFSFIWAHDTEILDHPRYRLQVALVIQLFFYLGLHPNVALSEGLYYEDTQILLKKHNGTVRVLLLIRLDNREKFAKSTKHWRRRTMILADMPSQRHICPVTLFLAFAIADNAVAGVSRHKDLTALFNLEWSGWRSLRYRDDIRKLSVLRRTGNKSKALSSCPMKPSAIHKMMQAQMLRGKHQTTYTRMQQDARMSAQREKRRLVKQESELPQPLLIGRGHAETVSELLTAVNIQSAALRHDAVTSTFNNFEFGIALPEVVRVQLKYDLTRGQIIAHLYGIKSASNQILQTLPPFVDAALAAAHEPYYLDTAPRDDGRCMWCGLHFARIPMKSHLLRCCQKAKNCQTKKQLTMTMREEEWVCKWAPCNASSIEDVELAIAHVTEHMMSQLQCQWGGCDQKQNSFIDLHIHLLVDHGVYTRATVPTRAKFCFECGQWISSELDWSLHAMHHAHNPHIIYGPISFDGILAAPRRCPYCSNEGVYLQMENHTQYIEHVEKHIHEELERNEFLECPHLPCERKRYEAQELKNHMRAIHAIILT